MSSIFALNASKMQSSVIHLPVVIARPYTVTPLILKMNLDSARFACRLSCFRPIQPVDISSYLLHMPFPAMIVVDYRTIDISTTTPSALSLAKQASGNVRAHLRNLCCGSSRHWLPGTPPGALILKPHTNRWTPALVHVACMPHHKVLLSVCQQQECRFFCLRGSFSNVSDNTSFLKSSRPDCFACCFACWKPLLRRPTIRSIDL